MAAENPPPEERPVLNPMEARQGRRGRHAMWILVVSLGLIVIIYGFMVLGVQGTRLNQPGGQTKVDQNTLQQSGGFQTPPPQARQDETDRPLNPDVPASPSKDQPPVVR